MDHAVLMEQGKPCFPTCFDGKTGIFSAETQAWLPSSSISVQMWDWGWSRIRQGESVPGSELISIVQAQFVHFKVQVESLPESSRLSGSLFLK